jgi:hypothetical protein
VLQSDEVREPRLAPEGLRLAARRPYGRNVFWFFVREGQWAPGQRVL